MPQALWQKWGRKPPHQARKTVVPIALHCPVSVVDLLVRLGPRGRKLWLPHLATGFGFSLGVNARKADGLFGGVPTWGCADAAATLLSISDDNFDCRLTMATWAGIATFCLDLNPCGNAVDELRCGPATTRLPALGWNLSSDCDVEWRKKM